MSGAFDYDRVRTVCYDLLRAIGEDPDREALRETPRRFADWWREFIEYDPGRYDTTFEAISSDQMVVVSGLRVHSLCEHHLLPFWCDVAVGYIARERVLGLSKFARLAQAVAHRLQIQERMVNEIADEIEAVTGSDDVAVTASGEHLCMGMRGIRMGGRITASAVRGVFKDKPAARAEFFSLIQHAEEPRR